MNPKIILYRKNLSNIEYIHWYKKLFQTKYSNRFLLEEKFSEVSQLHLIVDDLNIDFYAQEDVQNNL